MYSTLEKSIEQCNTISPFFSEWSSYSLMDFRDAFLYATDLYKGENVVVVDGIQLLKNTVVKELSSIEKTAIVIVPDGANALNHVAELQKDEFDLFILIKTPDLVRGDATFHYRGANNKRISENRSFLLADLEKYLQNDLLYGLFTLTGFEETLIDSEEFDQALALTLKELEDFLLPAQRYFEAGFERGGAYTHGDIEKEALKGIFSENEIYQVYYGNWLRDYASCIAANTVGFTYEDRNELKKGKYPNNAVVKANKSRFDKCFLLWNWAEIIEVFTVKEFIYERDQNANRSEDYTHNFNRFKKLYGELKSNDLGVYRPEEHIDNPKGLLNESVLSNALPGYAKLDHPILFYTNDSKGSKRKVTLYTGYEDVYTKKHASKNIKNYIVAEEKVKDGNKYYEIPTSLKYVIEQLKVSKLKGRNKVGLKHLGAALHTIEDYYAHSNFVEVALIKNGFDVFPWIELDQATENMPPDEEKAAKIIITTGTFGNEDMIASLAPKMANTFFPKTIQDYKRIKAGERTFGDHLILNVLEDMRQKAKNPKDAVAYGLKVKTLVDNYYTYLYWRDKWCKKVTSNKMYRRVDRALFDMMESILVYPRIAINQLLEQSSSVVKHKQTAATGYGTDPSHTQLAKDFALHPLNPLAGSLAVMVVKNVGQQMAEVWKGKKRIEDVIKFVREKVFVHPTEISWLDDAVIKWANSNPISVKIVKDANAFHDIDALLEQLRTPADEIRQLIAELVDKKPKKNDKKKR